MDGDCSIRVYWFCDYICKYHARHFIMDIATSTNELVVLKVTTWLLSLLENVEQLTFFLPVEVKVNRHVQSVDTQVQMEQNRNVWWHIY